MPRKSKYTLLIFYNNSNQQSLRVRVAINEFVCESAAWADLIVKEIDYEKDTSLAKEHRIFGTPAIVILKNERLVKRHLGEITSNELKAMLRIL